MVSHKDANADFISVIVSDSTRIHTQLLAEAMRSDPALQVVASASSSKEVLEVIGRAPIDVAVINYVLDDVPGRGPELLREIRALHPHVKGIILIDSSRPQPVLDSFRAGAKGIFSKQGQLENLCKCIRCVHEGQIWATGTELEHLLGAFASSPQVRAANQMGLDLLSPRECQVVQYLVAGMSNREIAKALALSPHTVKNYIFRIFDKLGVSNRMELLYMTLRQGAPAPFLQGRLTDPADSYDDASFDSSQKAAENGVIGAQLALARMLWKGRADDRDLVQAYEWFCIVVDQLISARNNVKSSLSGDQIAVGELRAREWLRRSRPVQASATDEMSLSLEGSEEMSVSETPESFVLKEPLKLKERPTPGARPAKP